MDKSEPVKGERWVGANTRVSNELLARMVIAAARVAFGAATANSAAARYGWAELCLVAEQAGLGVTVFSWEEVTAARHRALAAADTRGLNKQPPPPEGPYAV